MAVMEFIGQNIVNTTTQIAVQSNTGTAAYLYNRNRTLGYTSSGYNTTTATTITISFTVATPVSHILMLNHNIQNFSIFASGVSISVNTTNSATSTYLSFATLTTSQLIFTLTSIFTAGGGEKSIGELIIGNRQLQFANNPSIDNFETMIFRKQVRHEMPDGGVTLYNIRDKYRARIRQTFITEAFHNNLLSVYNGATPVYFLPYPTATAWDGRAYECVWSGDFNFKFSDNNRGVGYSGDIVLEETYSV